MGLSRFRVVGMAGLFAVCLSLFNGQLVAQDDNPGAVAWRRGVSLLDKGLVDAAIAQFTLLVRHDPEDPVSYCYRADAFARKRDWQEVLADAETALRLDRKLAWAYVLRGRARAGMKKPQEALADYAQAIRVDPQFLRAYVWRGYLYAELGESAKANQDFSTANRLSIQQATGGSSTELR
jgi:tetratricopeptide (TPR) repeat protein